MSETTNTKAYADTSHRTRDVVLSHDEADHPSVQNTIWKRCSADHHSIYYNVTVKHITINDFKIAAREQSPLNRWDGNGSSFRPNKNACRNYIYVRTTMPQQ
jgi:hypothetical protein